MEAARESAAGAGNDPFAVDEQRALETLRAEMGEWYDFGFDGQYRAARRDGTGPELRAATPDDLCRLVLADFGGRG